ncbi:MAG: 4'-phosphopantetheinyl transferase family protein [Candidatus Bipolaricaulia bacterium]
MTAVDRLWGPPPANLALSNDDIHVWRASLDLTASRVQSLQHTLTPDELDRAERFYFQKDREHFIVARGLLRAILGRYLNVEPSQPRFCYSPYGKPTLVTTSGKNTLSFNVSHSYGLALYAVTHGRKIGIDLERIRADFACEQIAERFFSPQENVVLRALPASMKHEAFFTCWTRKEAYVKAKSEGLSLPLDQFDVSLAPGEPAALLSTNWDPQEASRWSLQALTPGPGYVAALAVEGYHWQLKCWQWPGSVSDELTGRAPGP